MDSQLTTHSNSQPIVIPSETKLSPDGVCGPAEVVNAKPIFLRPSGVAHAIAQAGVTQTVSPAGGTVRATVASDVVLRGPPPLIPGSPKHSSLTSMPPDTATDVISVSHFTTAAVGSPPPLQSQPGVMNNKLPTYDEALNWNPEQQIDFQKHSGDKVYQVKVSRTDNYHSHIIGQSLMQNPVCVSAPMHAPQSHLPTSTTQSYQTQAAHTNITSAHYNVQYNDEHHSSPSIHRPPPACNLSHHNVPPQLDKLDNEYDKQCRELIRLTEVAKAKDKEKLQLLARSKQLKNSLEKISKARQLVHAELQAEHAIYQPQSSHAVTQSSVSAPQYYQVGAPIQARSIALAPSTTHLVTTPLPVSQPHIPVVPHRMPLQYVQSSIQYPTSVQLPSQVQHLPLVQPPPLVQLPPQVQQPSQVQYPSQVQHPPPVQQLSQVQHPPQVQQPFQVQYPSQIQHPTPMQHPSQVQHPPPIQHPSQVQHPPPMQHPSQVQHPPSAQQLSQVQHTNQAQYSLQVQHSPQVQHPPRAQHPHRVQHQQPRVQYAPQHQCAPQVQYAMGTSGPAQFVAAYHHATHVAQMSQVRRHPPPPLIKSLNTDSTISHQGIIIQHQQQSPSHLRNTEKPRHVVQTLAMGPPHYKSQTSHHRSPQTRVSPSSTISGKSPPPLIDATSTDAHIITKMVNQIKQGLAQHRRRIPPPAHSSRKVEFDAKLGTGLPPPAHSKHHLAAIAKREQAVALSKQVYHIGANPPKGNCIMYAPRVRPTTPPYIRTDSSDSCSSGTDQPPPAHQCHSTSSLRSSRPPPAHSGGNNTAVHCSKKGTSLERIASGGESPALRSADGVGYPTHLRTAALHVDTEQVKGNTKQCRGIVSHTAQGQLLGYTPDPRGDDSAHCILSSSVIHTHSSIMSDTPTTLSAPELTLSESRLAAQYPGLVSQLGALVKTQDESANSNPRVTESSTSVRNTMATEALPCGYSTYVTETLPEGISSKETEYQSSNTSILCTPTAVINSQLSEENVPISSIHSISGVSGESVTQQSSSAIIATHPCQSSPGRCSSDTHVSPVTLSACLRSPSPRCQFSPVLLRAPSTLVTRSQSLKDYRPQIRQNVISHRDMDMPTTTTPELSVGKGKGSIQGGVTSPQLQVCDLSSANQPVNRQEAKTSLQLQDHHLGMGQRNSQQTDHRILSSIDNSIPSDTSMPSSTYLSIPTSTQQIRPSSIKQGNSSKRTHNGAFPADQSQVSPINQSEHSTTDKAGHSTTEQDEHSIGHFTVEEAGHSTKGQAQHSTTVDMGDQNQAFDLSTNSSQFDTKQQTLVSKVVDLSSKSSRMDNEQETLVSKVVDALSINEKQSDSSPCEETAANSMAVCNNANDESVETSKVDSFITNKYVPGIKQEDETIQDVSVIQDGDEVTQKALVIPDGDEVTQAAFVIPDGDEVTQEALVIPDGHEVTQEAFVILDGDEVTQKALVIPDRHEVTQKALVISDGDEVTQAAFVIPDGHEVTRDTLVIPDGHEVTQKVLVIPDGHEVTQKALVIPDGDEVTQKALVIPDGDKVTQEALVIPDGDEVTQTVLVMPDGDEVTQEVLAIPDGDEVTQKALVIRDGDEVTKEVLVIPDTDEVTQEALVIPDGDEVTHEALVIPDRDKVTQKALVIPDGDKVTQEALVIPDGDEVTPEALVIDIEEHSMLNVGVPSQLIVLNEHVEEEMEYEMHLQSCEQLNNSNICNNIQHGSMGSITSVTQHCKQEQPSCHIPLIKSTSLLSKDAVSTGCNTKEQPDAGSDTIIKDILSNISLRIEEIDNISQRIESHDSMKVMKDVINDILVKVVQQIDTQNIRDPSSNGLEQQHSSVSGIKRSISNVLQHKSVGESNVSDIKTSTSTTITLPPENKRMRLSSDIPSSLHESLAQYDISTSTKHSPLDVHSQEQSWAVQSSKGSFHNKSNTSILVNSITYTDTETENTNRNTQDTSPVFQSTVSEFTSDNTQHTSSVIQSTVSESTSDNTQNTSSVIHSSVSESASDNTQNTSPVIRATVSESTSDNTQNTSPVIQSSVYESTSDNTQNSSPVIKATVSESIAGNTKNTSPIIQSTSTSENTQSTSPIIQSLVCVSTSGNTQNTEPVIQSSLSESTSGNTQSTSPIIQSSVSQSTSGNIQNTEPVFQSSESIAGTTINTAQNTDSPVPQSRSSMTTVSPSEIKASPCNASDIIIHSVATASSTSEMKTMNEITEVVDLTQSDTPDIHKQVPPSRNAHRAARRIKPYPDQNSLAMDSLMSVLIQSSQKNAGRVIHGQVNLPQNCHQLLTQQQHMFRADPEMLTQQEIKNAISKRRARAEATCNVLDSSQPRPSLETSPANRGTISSIIMQKGGPPVVNCQDICEASLASVRPSMVLGMQQRIRSHAQLRPSGNGPPPPMIAYPLRSEAPFQLSPTQKGHHQQQLTPVQISIPQLQHQLSAGQQLSRRPSVQPLHHQHQLSTNHQKFQQMSLQQQQHQQSIHQNKQYTMRMSQASTQSLNPTCMQPAIPSGYKYRNTSMTQQVNASSQSNTYSQSQQPRQLHNHLHSTQHQHQPHQHQQGYDNTAMQQQGSAMKQQGSSMQQQGYRNTAIQQQGPAMLQQGYGNTAIQQQGSAMLQQGSAMQQQGYGNTAMKQQVSTMQKQGYGNTAIQQQGSAIQQQGYGNSAIQQQGSAIQQQGYGNTAIQQQGSAIQQQGYGNTVIQQQGSAIQQQGYGNSAILQQGSAIQQQGYGNTAMQQQGYDNTATYQIAYHEPDKAKPHKQFSQPGQNHHIPGQPPPSFGMASVQTAHRVWDPQSQCYRDGYQQRIQTHTNASRMTLPVVPTNSSSQTLMMPSSRSMAPQHHHHHGNVVIYFIVFTFRD